MTCGYGTDAIDAACENHELNEILILTGNTLAGAQCLRLADEDGDAEGEYSHGDCRVGCARAERFVCPLRYARRFRASAMPFSFRH